MKIVGNGGVWKKTDRSYMIVVSYLDRLGIVQKMLEIAVMAIWNHWIVQGVLGKNNLTSPRPWHRNGGRDLNNE